MTPDDVVARAEITDVLARYCTAVDSRRFEQFDDLFAPGAVIDYSASGGTSGSVDQARDFLARALEVFSKTQHMLGLPSIDLHGERAAATVPCHNPMVLGSGRERRILVCALWYHVGLTRIDGAWRITELRQESCHMTFLQGEALEIPE